MANNPYLEDNPYLNGYNFNDDENKSASQPTANTYSSTPNSSYAQPSSTNQNTQANYYSNHDQTQSFSNNENKKEFDILDASTFVNTDPKVKDNEGEPYKEIKRKKEKPKTIKIKEKRKFSFKSFFLGIALAVVVLVTSLGFTIMTLYNNITLGQIQTWLNTDLTDGDINDYSIKDILGLVQGYDTLTIGNLESLLGFNLNEVSEDIAVAELLEELSTTYLSKGYKQIKITEVQNAVNTIINEITVDHFAKILCETKPDGSLKYFKQAILNKNICETLIACYTGKNIKLSTFFGEDFEQNINYINIGTLVQKVFETNENSSEFEKFIYNAFYDSQYGFYDLIKNYNVVLDSAIEIKDIVNSFIDENTTDSILQIIQISYKDNTSGITSFIEDFGTGLNEIKLSTIVNCLWPELKEEDINSNYDGFIKLIYDIYSNEENNIGVMDFANNISAQLNYIKVSNVISSFFAGDSKIEQFIQNVYGDYEHVGLGEFIDEFMNKYINDINVKNIIETFLDSDNKFVDFLIKIYTDDKYSEIGVSEFIDGFIDKYSKDITINKVIEFLVPENVNERTPFENLLVDLFGNNESDLFTAFSDIKGFIDEIKIKDFTDSLYKNDIITEKLKNLIYYSIHDDDGVILDEFENMGAYTYITNITSYINNITLQEILENTQNLPPLAEKIVKLFGKEGILDFVEKPLEYVNNLDIRTIARLYFDTRPNAKNTDDYPNNPDINIPSKFEEILKIEVQKTSEGIPASEIKYMGETTLDEFLKDREYYLDKITIAHLLEYLKENNSLAGLNENTYTFLIDHLGDYGLIYFKDNAAACIQKIKLGDFIDTLEKIGTFKGLQESKKMYLITFIKEEFSDLEIKDFVENFSTHLNSTTIDDLRAIIDKSGALEKDKDGNLTNKTQKILLDVVDYVSNSLRKKDSVLFKEYLSNEVSINNYSISLEQQDKIVEAYKTKSIEKLDFIINDKDLETIVLQIEDDFNKREGSPLRLNDYLTNAYKNITNLTIEDFCNIFEVKLTTEENETLSIYGKLLNQIKDKTLSYFLENSETLLKDALTTVVEESTIGQINDAFSIDLTELFKGYNEDTKINELFDKIDELTIGNMIGSTTSSLLQKFVEIKLVEIADSDTGVEAVIKNLVLGDLVSINKTIETINLYPDKDDVYNRLNTYFSGKFIETSYTPSKYFVYDDTNKTFKIATESPTDDSQIIKMTQIGGNTENDVIASIRAAINIYNTVSLDRFYIYTEGTLEQILSTDARITEAKNESHYEKITSFDNNTALKTGWVYELTAPTSFSYSFSLDSESWSYVETSELKTATISYTKYAYDEVLNFEENYNKAILPNDAIKINSFYLEYNGESKTFILNENYKESSKVLTILKHTQIKEIGEKVNSLTVGELFGEDSVLLKYLSIPADKDIKKVDIAIEDIDNYLVDISTLTLSELGELGIINTTNIQEQYKNKTIQQIIDEVLSISN